MSYNIYNLGKITGFCFDELNVAIVNGDKVILSDNDAVHTIHNITDRVCGGKTAKEILESEPIATTDNIGTWVRTFGTRIENNYALLLKSIKSIGLNPKDFPRK